MSVNKHKSQSGFHKVEMFHSKLNESIKTILTPFAVFMFKLINVWFHRWLVYLYRQK